MSECERAMTREEQQDVEIREMKAKIQYLESKIERLLGFIEGMREGLKFSNTCDSVFRKEVGE